MRTHIPYRVLHLNHSCFRSLSNAAKFCHISNSQVALDRLAPYYCSRQCEPEHPNIRSQVPNFPVLDPTLEMRIIYEVAQHVHDNPAAVFQSASIHQQQGCYSCGPSEALGYGERPNRLCTRIRLKNNSVQQSFQKAPSTAPAIVGTSLNVLVQRITPSSIQVTSNDNDSSGHSSEASTPVSDSSSPPAQTVTPSSSAYATSPDDYVRSRRAPSSIADNGKRRDTATGIVDSIPTVQHQHESGSATMVVPRTRHAGTIAQDTYGNASAKKSIQHPSPTDSTKCTPPASPESYVPSKHQDFRQVVFGPPSKPCPPKRNTFAPAQARCSPPSKAVLPPILPSPVRSSESTVGPTSSHQKRQPSSTTATSPNPHSWSPTVAFVPAQIQSRSSLSKRRKLSSASSPTSPTNIVPSLPENERVHTQREDGSSSAR